MADEVWENLKMWTSDPLCAAAAKRISSIGALQKKDAAIPQPPQKMAEGGATSKNQNRPLADRRAGVAARPTQLTLWLRQAAIALFGVISAQAITLENQAFGGEITDLGGPFIVRTLAHPLSGLFGAVLLLLGILRVWRWDSHVLGGLLIMAGTLLGLPALIFGVIQ